MNKNTHLTLDERKIIQTGIENRSRKVDIARTLGKDPSTIAKEIKKHRKLSPRNTFNYPVPCVYIKKCRGCKVKCSNFKEQSCSFRDRSPGACNKCPNIPKCHLDKYFYYATRANDEYLYTLVDCREGINLTTSERKEIADVIVPLLNQGQSLYQITSSHKEIKQCSKTLYNYIESGVFKDFKIDNFSLKEQVSRKQFKDKYKKRNKKQPSPYEGKTYKDYLIFKSNHHSVPTTQMDTVMNNLSGPYIQTFLFEGTNLMIGFLHIEKTSESMSNTLDNIQENILTDEEFNKLFSLILTDRGSEFEISKIFEVNKNTGEIRLNIFYCDPMSSNQKASIENNHNYIRDIIPNEISLDKITQDDLDLMFSHINSTPRKSLNGKTPYEMFEFIYGEDILKKFNIQKIERDKVILKPYLLKHK